MSNHYEIGDVIKYTKDGVEYEHAIHVVRYEEEGGRRVNVRYGVGVKQLEHIQPAGHKHNILCPILELEVPHSSVIEKLGTVPVPKA